MKKKLFTVLTVLMLVAVTLSAKSNSGLAIGTEIGFGFDKIKSTITSSDTVTRYKNIGPAVNVNVDYNFNEYWGVRANAGLGIFVKSSVKETGDYYDIPNAKTFVAFDAALDAKYTLHLSDNLTLSALAGLEILSGYVCKTGNSTFDSKLKNFSFGVNGAAELGYAINKNLTLKGGASFGYFFVNTTESLKSDKVRNSAFYLRPYLGVNYAF